jgi:hypothetical protein
MLLSVELMSLLFYCAQQLGVVLAVGAETIVLTAYLVAVRDGVINDTEVKFAHAVNRVLLVGIALIILSGLAIVGMHLSLGQGSVVVQPAFLFKWLLLIFVSLAMILRRTKAYMHFALEGLVGATWYAIFIVHILAPVASWSDLIVLYVLWTTLFLMCWSAIVLGLRRGKSAPMTRIPAIPIVSPPIQKPPVQKFAPPPTPRKPLPPVPAAPAKSPPATPPLHAPLKPITAVAQVPGKFLTPVLINLAPPPFLPIKPAVQSMPVPQKPQLPPLPQKPAEKKIEDADEYPELPAFKIMPRTVEEIQNQKRSNSVQ